MTSVKTFVSVTVILLIVLAIMPMASVSAEDSNSLKLSFDLKNDPMENEQIVEYLFSEECALDASALTLVPIGLLVGGDFEYVDNSFSIWGDHASVILKLDDSNSSYDTLLASDMDFHARYQIIAITDIYEISTIFYNLGDGLSTFVVVNNPDALKPQNVYIPQGTVFDVDLYVDMTLLFDMLIKSSGVDNTVSSEDGTEHLNFSVNGLIDLTISSRDNNDLTINQSMDMFVNYKMTNSFKGTEILSNGQISGTSTTSLNKIDLKVDYSVKCGDFVESTHLEPSSTASLINGMETTYDDYIVSPGSGPSGGSSSSQMTGITESFDKISNTPPDVSGVSVSKDANEINKTITTIENNLTPKTPTVVYVYLSALSILGIAGIAIVFMKKW